MLSRLLAPRRSGGPVPRLFAHPWGEFDRLFDEFWRGLDVAGPSGFQPRLDVREDENAIRVRAELPGLEPKDFEVTVEANLLILEGDSHAQSRPGAFRRVIRLPFEVEADRIEAAYKNGVLTLSVPKPERARPQARQIPVTTA